MALGKVYRFSLFFVTKICHNLFRLKGSGQVFVNIGEKILRGSGGLTPPPRFLVDQLQKKCVCVFPYSRLGG